MEVYGELYHIVCRNALPFVLGMREAGIGQVERAVQFGLCQGRIRRVYDHRLPSCFLEDACGRILIALFLDMAEVGGFFPLVFQAFLMREEGDVSLLREDLFFQINHLRNVGNQLLELLFCQGGDFSVVRAGCFQPSL